MKSHIQPFLAQKQQAGELDDSFFSSTSLTQLRIEAIIRRECGATIKEHQIVAKYFNVPYRQLLSREPIQLKLHKCEYCEEEFIPGNKKALYCSDKCRNKAFRANN